VQKGDHILPASKSRGARVLRLRRGHPLTLQTQPTIDKTGRAPLNLKMWPATKIISIHTYIIERNTYVGGMGGSNTHFPFPSPSLSLCLCFWESHRWWLVFQAMVMAVVTLLARVEKDRIEKKRTFVGSPCFSQIPPISWC